MLSGGGRDKTIVFVNLCFGIFSSEKNGFNPCQSLENG